MAGRILVVGGGLAGMSAAIALSTSFRGSSITLCEGGSRLGGRCGSAKMPNTGWAVDNCQHSAFRLYNNLLSLLAHCGGQSSIKLQPRTQLHLLDVESKMEATLTDGRLPPPNHLVGSVLKLPFLSFRDKFPLKKAVKQMIRMDESERKELDAISFSQWLESMGQSPTAISKFFDPFVLAALNLHCSEVSAAQAVMLFVTGLLSSRDAFDVGAFTSDLNAALIQPLEAHLREKGVAIKKRCKVTSLIWDGDVVKGVEYSKEKHEADLVILATSHREAARLLSATQGHGMNATTAKQVGEALGELKHSALIGLHAFHESPLLPEGFTFQGLVGEEVIQMLFDRSGECRGEKGIGCPPGHQWVSVPISSADPFLEWSDNQFRVEYERVVENLWPSALDRAPITQFMVIRHPYATFRASPNSAVLRPNTDAVGGIASNLLLAGDWTATGWPATMEGAVRSGLKAAAIALDYEGWNPDESWPDWPSPPQRGDESWPVWNSNFNV